MERSVKGGWGIENDFVTKKIRCLKMDALVKVSNKCPFDRY
jgi:hypothetical protein